MIDILVLFQHSKHGDAELRYALRSVEKYLECLGKVWVLGDRPAWLVDNRRFVEHVEDGYLARPFRFKLPVRSNFLLTFLGSLIPELSNEFLWMADDNVFLQAVNGQFLAQVRVFENLDRAQPAFRSAASCVIPTDFSML